MGLPKKKENKKQKCYHMKHMFYNLYAHLHFIPHFLLHFFKVPYKNHRPNPSLNSPFHNVPPSWFFSFNFFQKLFYIYSLDLPSKLCSRIILGTSMHSSDIRSIRFKHTRIIHFFGLF